jgi:hypothetical protein
MKLGAASLACCTTTLEGQGSQQGQPLKRTPFKKSGDRSLADLLSFP